MFKNEEEKKKFLAGKDAISSLELIREQPAEIFIAVDDKDLNATIAALSPLDVESFDNRKESLEDYFMKFYKEDKDFGGALK